MTLQCQTLTGESKQHVNQPAAATASAAVHQPDLIKLFLAALVAERDEGHAHPVQASVLLKAVSSILLAMPV